MRLLLIAAMLPLAACNANADRDERQAGAAQANGSSRTFTVSGFDSVDLRGPDNVDVKVGPNFAVTAEGDPAILAKLDIQVVNGDLRIGRQTGHNWFGKDKGTVRIHVIAPRISDATITGAGSLNVERVEGDVDATIAGAGDLVIGSVRADDAELSIAGSGDMKVSGTTRRLKASIAGAGDIDASELSATSGEISIAGAGSVRGQVRGDATIEILGTGDVELTGGARCKTRTLGPGEARCS